MICRTCGGRGWRGRSGDWLHSKTVLPSHRFEPVEPEPEPRPPQAPTYAEQDRMEEQRQRELDLVCCPPGTCDHAACEARYLRQLGLRRKPKDYNPITSATD